MELDHAVVVGGSFAGLIAARVLTDHAHHVTLIERDDLPDAPEVRRGVPQGPHVHGILKLGRDTLDELFPGFVAESQGEGAHVFDQIACGAMLGPYGWSARGPSSVTGYGVRRPLLEQLTRRRVRKLDRVEVLQGRVDGLAVRGRGRVVGVTLDGPVDPAARTVTADLVVDASGRGSGAPGWLEGAGFPPPAETLVNGFVGYASRYVHVPDDAWPGDMTFIAQLPMPGHTKGGIIYPQDGDRHIVSLFGQARDYPPGEEDGFDAFLRGCATPLLHRVASRSEPITEILTSRSTVNRWRHYERIADPPGGFVTVGDAAVCFNPMFGQGISSACLGAVTLGRTLAEVRGDVDRLPAVFQPRLAALLTFPWQVAVGFDLRFPETAGERGEPSPEAAEVGRHMDALAQLGTVDVSVTEALLLSTQLFEPERLHHPDLVAKARSWVAEGRTPPPFDPSRPPRLLAA